MSFGIKWIDQAITRNQSTADIIHTTYSWKFERKKESAKNIESNEGKRALKNVHSKFQNLR